MLAFSCVVPDTWVQVPTPGEELDLDNPAVFIPLLVCMAPYGAVVFTIAARPAFDDGSVQDWAEFLAAQNNLVIESVREARMNRMPCIVIDATVPSEVGDMRSRSVFLEDGRRLFNIGALAPQAIWASVSSDMDRLIDSFALDDVQGITAAPMRQMTSGSAIDLTALAETIASSASNTASVAPPRSADSSSATRAVGAQPANTTGTAADGAAPAIDLAIADDAATLDPDHEVNARLRDSGAGLVPRVLNIVADEKYAVVGAGAIESLFHVPFGWHVIDDGRRTLVFDVNGNVQINLNLRAGAADQLTSVLQTIGDELAAENPQALFLKLDMNGIPCLAVRDLLINGEQLDQAYFARASHRTNYVLVCRVTAARSEMTRAVNTAELILTSMAAPGE